MTIDSFKFLPRHLRVMHASAGEKVTPPASIPFTPPTKPLTESKVALITSAGIWNKDEDAPFDYERELREPSWGDPTHRAIASGIRPDQIGVGHLHQNNADIAADFNIVLPIDRLLEFEREGIVGAAASTHYSFMGYQGHPPDLDAWLTESAPIVASQLKEEAVDVLVLTPT